MEAVSSLELNGIIYPRCDSYAQGAALAGAGAGSGAALAPGQHVPPGDALMRSPRQRRCFSFANTVMLCRIHSPITTWVLLLMVLKYRVTSRLTSAHVSQA